MIAATIKTPYIELPERGRCCPHTFHRTCCMRPAAPMLHGQVPVQAGVAVHPGPSALAPPVRNPGDRQLRLPPRRANAARQLTTGMAAPGRRRPFTGPFVLAPRNSHVANALVSCWPSHDNPLGNRRGRQVESVVSS